MPVTQYIGARYVPLIFQNPDDNSNDWKAGIAYEPLTIVSYAGGSYTSKSAVPAGASNPVDAPEYWVAIGLYSGQTAINTNSITQIRHAITTYTEAGYVCTSPRTAGDYVWIAGNLYVCTANVALDEAYVEGINITSVNILDIIDSYFPISTNNIDDDAITSAKIDDGAVTSDKIAAGSINKSHMVSDKYVFIGDSYNTALHHGGWASKIITRLGLTLGTDCWSSGEGGAGMYDGRMLTQAQTIAGSLTAAQRESVTKVMVVSGANDWSAAESDIYNGVRNLENYLIAQFPNAELYLVAGEWAFSPSGIREGILAAYNVYAAAAQKMKFIDKAYLLFLCPTFLESDRVHPTASGMEYLGITLTNILNGGNIWTRKYSDLNAVCTLDDGVSGSDTFTMYGDISEAGTHVFKTSTSGVFFNTHVSIGNASVKIGTLTSNYLFQRSADIPCSAFVRYSSGGTDKFTLTRMLLSIRLNASNTWDVYLSNQAFIENSWTASIDGIYLMFDTMLDFTKS